MMTYKGYSGEVEFDDEANILHGRVTGITDVITFQGETVEEIRQAFHDSIDDYLEFCRELGKAPQKPLAGTLLFRTSPERHRKIFLAAERADKSIDEWMDDALAEAADRVLRTGASTIKGR